MIVYDNCPFCGTRLDAPSTPIGSGVVCPKCSRVVVEARKPTPPTTHTPVPPPKRATPQTPSTQLQETASSLPITQVERVLAKCASCNRDLGIEASLLFQSFDCPFCQCENTLLPPPRVEPANESTYHETKLTARGVERHNEAVKAEFLRKVNPPWWKFWLFIIAGWIIGGAVVGTIIGLVNGW